RRLAEEHKRSAHIGDFVTVAVLNVDIQVAVGDAPHRVTEETQALGDISSDIEPCDQCRADHGGDREHDQYQLARTDLSAGVSRYFLCNAALVFHERIDGVLELGCLR